jgi:hypothetical protein
LPSAVQLTIGKGLFAARDLALGKEYFNIFKKSLPSARDLALGKAVE